MKKEEIPQIKVGDFVEPSEEAFRSFRFNIQSYPWRVHKIEGDLIWVERESHKTRKIWLSSYHFSFLDKVK